MYVRLVKTRDSLSLFSGTIDEKTHSHELSRDSEVTENSRFRSVL